MNLRRLALIMSVMMGAIATLTLLWLLSNPGTSVTAAPVLNPGKESVERPLSDATPIHYVAITGTDSGDCSTPVSACLTIQYAVDRAGEGDKVRVATGVYTDVNVRPRDDVTTTGVVTQVVYISKTLTIQGGYTTSNGFAGPPNPISYPTTLDAQGRGRVLYISGDISPTIEGLRITGGDATGLWSEPGDGLGGGVYVSSTAATFSDNVVYGNIASRSDDWSASGNGGGMCVRANSITLKSNTIRDNIAGMYRHGMGGGLTIVGNNVVLRDNRIVSNTAAFTTAVYVAAGGLLIGGDSVTLTGNTILSNTGAVFSFDSSMAFGGGMAISGDNATLNGNTIQGNITTVSGRYNCGGGLYLEDINITLNDNIIRGNIATISGEAGDGGGICEHSYSGQGNTVLNGNVIEGNVGSISGLGIGGGAFLYKSNGPGNFVFNDNKILSNTATVSGTSGPGGGVALAGDEAIFNNNIFRGNVASTYGGGVALYAGNATLTNTVVVDNQATSGGAGLMIEGGSAYLLHTTIARNSGGDGSGVYVDVGNDLVMTNTVLVSQTVGISAASAYNTVILNGVLWYRTPTTVSAVSGATISINNQFVDGPVLATDGYHLLPGSPAIDRGMDAGVSSDIDGEPRNIPPDLGADEFWFTRIHLPVILRAR